MRSSAARGRGCYARTCGARGETRPGREAGGYLGFRDLDAGLAALKLGDTLAGYWVQDLLAAIEAARVVLDRASLHIVVRGEREMGLVAILAAGVASQIDAVETHGLLASYGSSKGYRLPFAYADAANGHEVGQRKLGGYGSMVPCIPHLLKKADVAQLVALVAPRPLLIDEPLDASGEPADAAAMEKAWVWTELVYRLHGAEGELRMRIDER